jgi:glycosyltransferase involved in cell wall biosynthesis
MVKLASGFAARGLSVDLVLSSAVGPWLAEVPPSVRVIDLQSTDGVLRSLPALVRYLRRQRPRVLVSSLEPCNVVALWARQFAHREARVVIRIAGHLSRERDTARTGRSRVLKIAARRCYRSADGIVAVSHGVADDVARDARLPRDRIRVLDSPIVTPELLQLASGTPNHPWFCPGQPPVILGVGRLVWEKDFSTLVRAFSCVRRTRPARLVILGEGPERARLESLATELGIAADVALPGFVANPYPWMAGAGVVALSARLDGQSNVLVEAMACGTPVVSTDCPSGPREILDQGRAGMLVSVGDSAALAVALVRTIDSPPGRDVMRSRAVERFAWDRGVSNYLEVCGLAT